MEIPISYALVQIKEILAPIISNALRYGIVKESVCFPYEFTLLSNIKDASSTDSGVCFPYEFTLLSNANHMGYIFTAVCFPYEFTLLSNHPMNAYIMIPFVSPTNLHCSQTKSQPKRAPMCLFPLRIYTALKLVKAFEIPEMLFVSPTNLHCSQTRRFK